MLSVVSLLLYCVQQLGVVLGVGAETVVLVAVLSALRDRVVDAKEERFARAVKRVRVVGMVFILLSGIAITALELTSQDQTVVLAPAYLFKCILILVVLLLAALVRGESTTGEIFEGLAGGTWYALFVVHILAPVTTWLILGELYLLWLGAFMLCWITLVFLLRERGPAIVSSTAQTSGASVISDSRPMPAQMAPVAKIVASPIPKPIIKIQIPSKPAVAAPTPESAASSSSIGAMFIPPAPGPQDQVSSIPLASATIPGLPAIRVMPQKEEDLKTQHRGPAVQFG